MSKLLYFDLTCLSIIILNATLVVLLDLDYWSLPSQPPFFMFILIHPLLVYMSLRLPLIDFCHTFKTLMISLYIHALLFVFTVLGFIKLNNMTIKPRYIYWWYAESIPGLILQLLMGIGLCLSWVIVATTQPDRNRTEQIEMMWESVNVSQTSIAEKCCCICLERLEAGARVTRIKECKHVYHKQCLREWVSTRPSCPMCRKSLRLN